MGYKINYTTKPTHLAFGKKIKQQGAKPSQQPPDTFIPGNAFFLKKKKQQKF